MSDVDDYDDEDEVEDANLVDEDDLEDDEDDEDEGPDPNRVPASTARNVLEYLARSVVDDPDAVEVDVDETGRDRIELSVRVAAGDMGRVIGKRGRVANAIRTVVRAAAVRDGVDVDVEFVD